MCIICWPRSFSLLHTTNGCAPRCLQGTSFLGVPDSAFQSILQQVSLA